jgi:hypothetical protein
MAKIKDEQLAKINELKGKFNELTFLIGQNKINQTNLKVEEVDSDRVWGDHRDLKQYIN